LHDAELDKEVARGGAVMVHHEHGVELHVLQQGARGGAAVLAASEHNDATLEDSGEVR
jgi:hypothetical protein